jgi:hypothetical protein
MEEQLLGHFGVRKRNHDRRSELPVPRCDYPSLPAVVSKSA